MYQKSAFSGAMGGNCVEFELNGDNVSARDSKDRGAGNVLIIPLAEWESITAGLLDAEVTHVEPSDGTAGAIKLSGGRLLIYGLTEAKRIASLAFNAGEAEAFIRGLKEKAFAPA